MNNRCFYNGLFWCVVCTTGIITERALVTGVSLFLVSTFLVIGVILHELERIWKDKK